MQMERADWTEIKRRASEIAARECDRRRRETSGMGPEEWILVLGIIGVIGNLLLDGWAVAHGQPPMFFGR